MKGSKKLNQLLEDNEKKLKSFLNMIRKNLCHLQKKIEKVEDQYGVYVIFDGKKPIFVGQTGGYATGYKPIQKI